jgi:hypothetical protein
MKVRAIVVVLLALAVIATGCTGQKSAYSHSSQVPGSAHGLYGTTAMAAGFQVSGGSPFSIGLSHFKIDPYASGNTEPATNLPPAESPFTLIGNNPFTRMLSDGFAGLPLAGALDPSGAGGSIKYLNFTYAPSSVAMPGEDGLYSTGEMWNGKTIYVSSKLAGPDRVPRTIFVKNDDGSYSSYTLSDTPAVYAYILYGTYNTAESVTFGMVNDHGGSLMLNSPAPWEVQQKVNGQWKTIYAPMAAQVLTPLDQGGSTEWTWDQKLDDGTLAPWGECRVLVQGQYVAPFKINKGSPMVESRFTTYDNATANAEFGNAAQVKAFSEVYSAATYSNTLRDELISEMQYKAWMKGMDASKLKSAVASTSEYATNATALPCLAVYSRYNNQPAWFLVFSWGTEAGAMSHPLFYVVSDSTGQQLCTYVCK